MYMFILLIQIFILPDLEALSHDETCSFDIVESIPIGLTFNSSFENMRTFEAWQHLFDLVEDKLELASSYWTLRGSDVYEHPSDWQGEKIYDNFVNASKRGIKVLITQNLQSNKDTDDLSKLPGISVRSLNFTRLVGNGILHSKLWIADRKHFYVGSANFDWRSLTQVKELGILVRNCPVLAEDMAKIFEVYWYLGGPDKHVPSRWPKKWNTNINVGNPKMIFDSVSQSNISLYLSSSPMQFCPRGRTRDLDSILRLIDEAEEFIYIAVMDYYPQTIYQKEVHFWPLIDDKLRKAAINRNVKVRLLLSHWPHTHKLMINYLRSLTVLHDYKIKIEGKMFKVPSFTPDQAKIPYARVNHNKYMVTEKSGFIGTSNWSADYFLNTGGIGFTFEGDKLRKHLVDIFLRDWNSSYASRVY